MRTVMALLVLALGIGVSACGGSSEGPVGEAPIVTPTSTSGAPTSTDEARGRDGRKNVSCAARGITTPPFKEGACVQRGTRYVVANGRSVLRLRTLSAAIAGLTVSETIPGHEGEATPQGVFVFIRLNVMNLTDKPQRFQPGQTRLALRDQPYDERVDVETDMHPSALGSKRRVIQPDELVQGEVVFDVPLEAVERVSSEGMLYVVNFGGASGGRPEFGQIRIYHP